METPTPHTNTSMPVNINQIEASLKKEKEDPKGGEAGNLRLRGFESFKTLSSVNGWGEGAGCKLVKL